jgi:hypothetical protein
MKTINKYLLSLLGLDIIFALLIGVVGSFFGYDWQINTITTTVWSLFERKYGDDSWKVMGIAWQYWLDHNKDVALYSEMLIKDGIKYIYPPNTLLIIKYLLAFQADFDVFFTGLARFFLLVNMAAVAVVAFHSIKLFNDQADSSSRSDKAVFAILIGLLTLVYYPIGVSISLGQSQAWLNALFAAALLCYMTGNSTLAGIFIGIMASFKPQYGLFVLWGLLRKDWKLIIAILSSALVIVAAGALEFGILTYFDYLKALGYLSRHGEAFMSNQSVNGLLNRFLGVAHPDSFNITRWLARYYPPYVIWVYLGTMLSSLVLIGFSIFGRSKQGGYISFIDFCIMGLGSTMASPIAWEHHYGILLPILALLGPLFWFGKTKFNTPFYRALFIVLYLISGNLFWFLREWAYTYWNFVQSLLLFTAGGIFLLMLKIRYSNQFELVENDINSGMEKIK